jgi:hypothetical protein
VVGALERDEGGAGDPGREVLAEPVGNRAIAAAVQHPHRRRDLPEAVGDVEGVDAFERPRRQLRRSRLTLEFDESLPLSRRRVGHEDVGEDAGADAPMAADDADDRLAGVLVGDLRTARVGAVRDQTPHPLGTGDRVGGGDRASRGGGEEVDRLGPDRVDDAGEDRDLVVEAGRRRLRAVGEAGAGRVVADHGAVAAERFDEALKAGSRQFISRWLIHQPPRTRGGPSPTVDQATWRPSTVVNWIDCSAIAGRLPPDGRFRPAQVGRSGRSHSAAALVEWEAQSKSPFVAQRATGANR